MKELSNTLFGRVLGGTAEWVLRHRKIVFFSQLALFAVSVFYTVKFLEFDTSRDNLSGAGSSSH